MARGGYREGGGRPSGFVHTPTQTVRVPVALADQVLELAQKLDKGELIVDDTIPKKDRVVALLEEALTLKSNAGSALKQKIREALAVVQE